ncbi:MULTISPECIES: HK97 family phage prohead protease [unclassified Aureimonas]|uniref:HK97 family phage prohead protease n=1 Tax=unclassified Aureimonas TaxID=2615206 RepID=UPI0006FEE3A0|nr:MULTISPECIES: HK97 family phage prohead protease [unclassified Aureimonas]KQT55264.1 hypothetical protein ASG62_10560 [Aureimonas sp. Leaf427]KQT71055.1 hypothetical protein ASG54_20945 [Aureimonas sp. Leaf460]
MIVGGAERAVAGVEGRIAGYASLFGAIDLSGDRVLPGAFLASLRRRGTAGIRMLWQHDPARPIGVWTKLTETATGLFAEGRLALDTAGGREAFELIRAGAVDGLSIGFRTKTARRGSAGAKRLLEEIDLWEISVVTFPMQESARLSETRGGMAAVAAGAALAARIEAAARWLAAPSRASIAT